MTENLIDIGAVGDFPENTMHPLELSGRSVLLVHQGGRFYALENRCTHKAYPLHTGELLEGAVKCEWHGAKFNLETGKPTLPAVKKVRLYDVRVQDGRVLVAIQEA
jgi:3-phenylpropionate/trans-cinnamate dioxygenase ferredoxin subunit